eukprot:CAMPEP_0172488638 /NCGR_PEP_ID=MMETSP1066-20121228/18277_1 /TAXON_ID=671091 /ORGANISM="Coscinodiscus wailesii, Strain CCMP2513" /LENGTH=98 /DNA_ID=CAMNT_0013255993 /DNA_START=63 /DNA_END=356 /DNA_ORIENTATION=-
MGVMQFDLMREEVDRDEAMCWNVRRSRRDLASSNEEKSEGSKERESTLVVEKVAALKSLAQIVAAGGFDTLTVEYFESREEQIKMAVTLHNVGLYYEQ